MKGYREGKYSEKLYIFFWAARALQRKDTRFLGSKLGFAKLLKLHIDPSGILKVGIKKF